MYVWQLSVYDYYSNTLWNKNASSYNKDTTFCYICVTFHLQGGGC
jgi:hypothetical protein